MYRADVKLCINDSSPDMLHAFCNETLESDPPPRKRQKLSANGSESSVTSKRDTEGCLTVARVDLSVTFAGGSPGFAPDQSLFLQISKKRPVLFKAFKRDSNDRCHCHITTLDGVTLLSADGHSTISPQASEVLVRAAGLSVSRKTSNATVVAWIASATGPGFKAYGHIFQLCVEILLPDAKDLSEGSSTSRILLDLCTPQPTAQPHECWSSRDFYDNVFVPDRCDSPEDFRIERLKCQLYPFQYRAVRWLLEREGVTYDGANLQAVQNERKENSLSHGFVPAIDANGRDCFISRFLGLMTTEIQLAERSYANFSGGILAEEMGLGKTVEIIALICLHQQYRAVRQPERLMDGLQTTPASLIITPPSILDQWLNELKTISPDLKIMVYHGMRRKAAKLSHQQLIEQFRCHDVVLTTYNVLAAEIHYAPAPIRNFRHQRTYERRLSPITEITWWRVVLDEAQMIEHGVNNAARVAQLIPRQNAWAVSGTPVRKDAKDLFGLLAFLRCQPLGQAPQLYDRLVLHHRDIFKQIFKTLSLRHTKEQVKDDIKLPSQQRVVITIPFTQIEEQHYSTLYGQMCDECGVDLDGCPIAEGWDPKSSVIIEKLRSWLTRLRQTCLHPGVGSRNRRALGTNKGPLRTVDEVLEVMMEQNVATTRAEERALLLSQIRRGQLLEHANRSADALDIWLHTLQASKLVVEDCRNHLLLELNEVVLADGLEEQSKAGLIATSRTGVQRQRLRSALEMEHMCTFFVANAYFQIKTDQKATQPDSADFRRLQKMEDETYEKAKSLRKELLTETHDRAEVCMNIVQGKIRDQSFVRSLNIAPLDGQGGIESRNAMARSNDLLCVLQDGARQLEEWREKLIGLLLLPLVDEEKAELEGDEYEASTKQQDEIYVYMDAVRSLVADRHEVLTGQINTRVDQEMKFALEKAKDGEGHAPILLRKLLSTRERLKPPKELGSLRGLITYLRDLKTSFRSQVENGNTRAAAELIIVNSLLHELHSISIEQAKLGTGLDRELDLFKDTSNARLEYYRQLQQISDSVAAYESEMDEQTLITTLASMLVDETKLRDKIATLNARHRYLIHLRDDASLESPQRLCIICQQSFETGVLTSCGHSFCVECLRLWWSAHRNCPTCKKHLSRNDFHQITYKPKEFILEEEQPQNQINNLTTPISPTIYSGIRDATLAQIKNIDVAGSFGTKIDTLARHILWIRANDPGAKSIIFSQFRDFLDILGKAFAQFKIGFTGIDCKDGVRKFKEDPGLECFFLHAKAHSSGLNLVNATHVFLCEPLINTAIELQAIARVHRIGQHQSTTVWMYLVENTVERSIYEISVNRRMSHIRKPQVGRLDEVEEGIDLMENEIQAANTLELQAPLAKLITKGSAGGEMVDNDDLWNCLFRQKPAKNVPISFENQQV